MTDSERINPNFIFKGERFVNRYRLTGILETQSPLHIGTGERRPEKKFFVSQKILDLLRKEKENVPESFLEQFQQRPKKQEDQAALVDTIARDFDGRPYLPGSSIRGVVRHYLLQVFCGINPAIANAPDYEAKRFKEKDQRQLKEYMRKDASLLEQVFGTPFAESKVEFWDASLIKKADDPQELDMKGWDSDRQSYIVRSVSIDPETGSAEPNKLYSFEVVPPGAQFEITVTGQNLNAVEMGLVLFGIYGFNSAIYPLTIGAMASRGFGRMRFTFQDIRGVTTGENGNLRQWAAEALTSEHAGYNTLLSINEAEAKQQFITAFKARL